VHREKTDCDPNLISAFPAKAGNQSRAPRLVGAGVLDARFRGQGNDGDACYHRMTRAGSVLIGHGPRHLHGDAVAPGLGEIDRIPVEPGRAGYG
jgi:hypothetical protein